jgi:hypothetical protein
MRYPNPGVPLRAGALAMLAALSGAAVWADTPDQAANGVTAVWTPKEVRFVYMGFTSKFSCDGLADRIRSVLLVLGARKDLKVSPSACSTPFGRPDPFPGVTIKMNVLQPADSSNGSNSGNAAADYRRVMIACLNARGYGAQPGPSGGAEDVSVSPRNGQSEAQTQSDRYECHRWGVSQTGYDPTRAAPQSSGNAAAQTVPAHWKLVDVNTALARDPLWQAGQCELLEQIKQSILPQFSARNVQYTSTCIPNQLYIGATQLKAEMLVPDPPKAPAPAAPAASR